jgi:hypothetical protein
MGLVDMGTQKESQMDAHANEYLAAVAGLHEQTLSPAHKKPEPAVGDFVSGKTAGRYWSGRVEWVNDRGEICVNTDGSWVYVPVADITH